MLEYCAELNEITAKSAKIRNNEPHSQLCVLSCEQSKTDWMVRLGPERDWLTDSRLTIKTVKTRVRLRKCAHTYTRTCKPTLSLCVRSLLLPLRS